MQPHNDTSVRLSAVSVIIGNTELRLRSTWVQINDTREQTHGFPGLLLSDLKGI